MPTSIELFTPRAVENDALMMGVAMVGGRSAAARISARASVGYVFASALRLCGREKNAGSQQWIDCQASTVADMPAMAAEKRSGS